MTTMGKSPPFSLGLMVITPAAREQLTQYDIVVALQRHLSGDWGELEEFDWKVNDEALEYGNRLLSAYRALSGIKFWVITECDRSATTILLPEDY